LIDTPKTAPIEDDLLLPFERENLPKEYKEYYGIKRGNFFASIQRFPEMWNYYMTLDMIWLREFDDLKPSADPDRMFPLILFLTPTQRCA
jgi:hypothetical protein